MLETVTAGIVAFFAAQPAMLDQVPQLGHIPKIFKAMSSRTDCIPKSSLQIVQQLAASEVCLRFTNTVTVCVDRCHYKKLKKDRIELICISVPLSDEVLWLLECPAKRIGEAC
jgi:DnaJ family protein C protein 13